MQSVLEISANLRPEYLRVLSETATLLLHDISPDEVARAVFAKLSPLLGLDAYFHYLLSPDGSHLELQSCAGAPPETLPLLKRLELGQAVCGTAAKRCQPIYVREVQNCHDNMTEFIRGCGIQCYLCHPLTANGELLGTFSFGTKRRKSYNEEERELLHLVAQQISLSVRRRKQSERLRQMEKLALAGRFAASISHEINNPLEAVSNLLYLLGNEPLSKEGREYLTLAASQLQNIAEISKQVLGFYRGNTKPAAVRIREVVDNVLRILADRIRTQQVQVETDIPDDASAFACGGEVQQVVLNVVKNAVEAVGTYGRVRIEAGLDAFGFLELTVTDSGTGVPPEVVSRIFEPFFTTKNTTGTGLGLWVTQQLVRKNGGEIRLASSTVPPTGTRVCVTLPRSAALSSAHAV